MAELESPFQSLCPACGCPKDGPPGTVLEGYQFREGGEPCPEPHRSHVHFLPRAFYFGCWREPGHHLWHRGRDGYPYKDSKQHDALMGRSIHSTNPGPGEIPWGYSLDGGLLKYAKKQGEAVVEQRDGWTALSFWDRSVDSRPGSCSTFVFDALLTPEEALAAARGAFPPIFERFDFEVVLDA